MDVPVHVEGVGEGVVVRSAGILEGPHVLVHGQPAPSPGRNRFTVPGADGSNIELTLVHHALASVPDVEIGGTRHQLAPRLHAGLFALSALPLVLIGVGRLIGGLFGGLGFGVNQMVVRSSQTALMKCALMVGVSLGAALLYLVGATGMNLACR